MGERAEANADGVIVRRRAVAFPALCRSWRCRCCTGRLRRKYRAKAYRGLVPGRARYLMLTLTIDPSSDGWVEFVGAELDRQGLWSRDPGATVYGEDHRMARSGLYGLSREAAMRAAVTKASIRYVQASWNRLNVALRRVDRRPVDGFFRGLELQKNGRAHLHVLVRYTDAVDVMWWRSVGRRLAVAAGFGDGMGYDASPLRSWEGAASYVSKVVAGASGTFKVDAAGYAGKALDHLPKHARRFSWSREWAEWTPPTPIAGFGWRIAHGSVPTITRALEASGVVVDDPDRFRLRSSAGGQPLAGGLVT